MRRFCLMAAFAAVTVAYGAGNVPSSDRVKLGGRLGAKMDACIERSVKAGDVSKMTDVFRTQKETILWQSEFWGKWMHSAVPYALYSGDVALRDGAIRSAKEIMACQLPDGYIGNYAPEKQCGEGTWDVWGRKYTLLGLVHSYDLTGDRAPLACCGRMVDHLMTQVGPRLRSLAKTGSHRGLASLSILEPLVLLWECTQDVRYRKAIDYVLSEMCDNPEGPELLRRSPRDVAARFADGGVRDSNSPAKAYEMMSCYQGLLEWYRTGGERKYLDACVRTARNIAATEINVLGSGSSLECWYGGKAKETQTAIGAMETCVTTTWMRFLESLFAATGDPFYADELERTLYNAYLGAMKRDGSGWLQYCPPNGSRGQGNLQCGMGTSCCIQNGPRGFLAALRALVVGRDDGVDVGLYAESSATVKAAGGEVTVTQRTDYPRSGKVCLTIGCKGTKAEWTLRMRLPRWCTADGKPTWREIRRNWKDGDTYELDLDMRPRTVAKDGHLAVFWGPIALARSGIFGDGETGEMLARPFGDDWCPLKLTPVDPGEALVVFEVPMPFGAFTGDKRRLPAGIRTVKMCDWASAGDLWRPDASARVWLPVCLDPSAPGGGKAAFCP